MSIIVVKDSVDKIELVTDTRATIDGAIETVEKAIYNKKHGYILSAVGVLNEFRIFDYFLNEYLTEYKREMEENDKEYHFDLYDVILSFRKFLSEHSIEIFDNHYILYYENELYLIDSGLTYFTNINGKVRAIGSGAETIKRDLERGENIIQCIDYVIKNNCYCGYPLYEYIYDKKLGELKRSMVFEAPKNVY